MILGVYTDYGDAPLETALAYEHITEGDGSSPGPTGRYFSGALPPIPNADQRPYNAVIRLEDAVVLNKDTMAQSMTIEDILEEVASASGQEKGRGN